MGASRERCNGCGYAPRVCLCAWVQPQPLPVPVVILQDALERRSAKSTVPLLQLALPQVEVIGADDAAAVERLKARVLSEPEVWGLVYPTADSHSMEKEAARRQTVWPTAWLFLDGTWKKTRRLLHEHSWLADVPSYRFSQAPLSGYHIRKVPNAVACSTLESVAWVLQITQDFEVAPLYELQRHFVLSWQRFQPAAHQR
ncbi:MAG: DTW domain-containing protein [Natronospirillum sp.]